MPKQPFTCSSTTPCRSLAHNHIHRPCRVDQNSLPTCASVFDDHTNNKTAWIHAYSAHRNTYVTLSSTNPASILMMFSEIWYGSAGKLCQLPCFWSHTCCLPLVLATIHLLRCSCRVEHNALPTRASTWQNSKYFTRFGTSVIELRSSINSSTQGVRNYFLKLVSFDWLMDQFSLKLARRAEWQLALSFGRGGTCCCCVIDDTSVSEILAE